MQISSSFRIGDSTCRINHRRFFKATREEVSAVTTDSGKFLFVGCECSIDLTFDKVYSKDNPESHSSGQFLEILNSVEES